MTEPRHSAGPTDAPILAARDVRFAYRADAPVLRGVDCSARPGRLLCILGPNGSGKTTLLRCMLGQLALDAGTVTLEDKPIRRYGGAALAKRLAYVPQSPLVAPGYTARQVVQIGRLAHLGAWGLLGRKDRRIVDDALERTQTEHLAGRRIEGLSGGEMQRVMIARALAQQPRVCLLDEATSHLDIRHQFGIYELLQRLAREDRMAVVCVSHDINLAARHADDLLLLRDGRPVAAGPTSQTFTAETLRATYDVTVEFLSASDGQTIAHMGLEQKG